MASPAEDQVNIPEPYKITPASIGRLKAFYERGNDNLAAWSAEIAVLRASGLEPVPSRKHFYEIGGLIQYLCGLVVTKTAAGANSPYNICINGLVVEPVTGAVKAGTPAPKVGSLAGSLFATRTLPFMPPVQLQLREAAKPTEPLPNIKGRVAASAQ